MTTDPSKIVSVGDVEDLFGYMASYEDFEKAISVTHKSIKEWKIVSVVSYIVLIYSEDSFLNQNPPLTLEERQLVAAKISKLPTKKNGDFIPLVKTNLFDLKEEHIFKFIFEYLIREKKHLWQEIISLESNMLENQKLRLIPVENNDLGLMQKKDGLIRIYKGWRKQLAEYYDEFYGQNQQVRTIHKMNRANMAVIENYATL